MACDCWERTNEALKEHNTQIVRPMQYRRFETPEGWRCTLEFAGVEVATAKVDTTKRGKPVTFLATYCPICGTRYEQEAI